MDCSEHGFSKINARKFVSPAISNVRALCHNSANPIESNHNTIGAYSTDLICAGDQQVVGVQLKEAVNQVITNMRFLCA